MKKNIQITFTCFFFILLSILFFAALSIAKKADKPAQAGPATKLEPSGTVMLAKKADLVVDKIIIQKIAQDPAIIPPGKPVKVRYQVQINVTVKNSAMGPKSASTADSLTAEGRARHCAGASKLLLEWTEDPTMGFNRLGEAGIIALAPGASKTVSFTQWVPKGAVRKYRATADHLNWIAEWDKGNNINSAGYIAR